MFDKEINIDYFHTFKKIGSCTFSNENLDIDYLVVIKDDKLLNGLLSLIEYFNKSKPLLSSYVITDSYFLPFISKYSPDKITHIIFFYSEQAFNIDFFSHLVSDKASNEILLPQKSKLSIILAMQDVIKMWLLKRLNKLTKTDEQILGFLIQKQIDKWLNSKNVQLNDSELGVLKKLNI